MGAIKNAAAAVQAVATAAQKKAQPIATAAPAAQNLSVGAGLNSQYAGPQQNNVDSAPPPAPAQPAKTQLQTDYTAKQKEKSALESMLSDINSKKGTGGFSPLNSAYDSMAANVNSKLANLNTELTSLGNQQNAMDAVTVNRVDSVTPYGSTNYSQDPNNPLKWTATQTLSPAQQAAFDQNARTNAALGNAVESGLGAATTAANKPLTAQPLISGVRQQQFAGPVAQSKFNTTLQNNANSINTGYNVQNASGNVRNPMVRGISGADAQAENNIVDNSANYQSGVNYGQSQQLNGMFGRAITDANANAPAQTSSGATGQAVIGTGADGQAITTTGATGQSATTTGANARATSTTGANAQATGVSGANAQATNDIVNNADKYRSDVAYQQATQQTGATQQAQNALQNNADRIRTATGQDPALLNQQTQDALYAANTQYLDKQFQKSDNALRQQLANQGITQGSEAWNNAMDMAAQQKEQAYSSARNQAIGGSMAAAQGMFGMGMQNAQFGNQALGQQFNQNVTAQQVGNQAVNQNNQQAMANAQFANQAAQQNNQNAFQNANLNNAATAAQFNQGLQTNQFGNQVAQQNNAQAMANSQFANQAANQNNQLAIQNAQFGNQAAMQNNAQDVTNAAFANQATQQNNQTAFQNSQFANQATQQNNQNALANAQFGNQAVNQNNQLALANAQFSNQALNQNNQNAFQNAQFTNQAIGQNNEQEMQRAAFNNQAMQQNNANAFQNANLNNAATGAQFAQGLQANQFGNQVAQQNNQNALANSQFYNQAAGQQFNQNLSAQQLANQAAAQNTNQNQNAATFANQALGQQFSQNAAASQFANQTMQNQFAQGQQNAALQNQYAQGMFGQGLQNAQLNNTVSNQGLAQQQTMNQNGLNMINALRTGQQMQVATLPNQIQSANMSTVAGPDYLGAQQVANQYQMGQQQYNLGLQNANAMGQGNMINGLFGLGAAYLGAQ